MSTNAAVTVEKKNFLQKMLDGVEKVGNKVPHPVLMFLYLIAFIIVLSHVLYMLGVSVTTDVIEPVPVAVTPYYYEDTTYPPVEMAPANADEDRFEIREETIPIRSLLTIDGIRFIFTSFLTNFAGFTVVATIFVAMIGVGVAEEAGMMGALIRKLVKVAPARLDHVYHRSDRRSLQCGDRRRLSDSHSSGCCGLLEFEATPGGGAGGGFCRRKCGLCRQYPHRTARRHAHRDDQRGVPVGESDRVDQHRGESLFQYLLHHLHGHRRHDRHRAHDRAAPGQIRPRSGRWRGDGAGGRSGR